MARIATSEFLFHLWVAVLPEVRYVFGHLPRAVIGGEYMNEQGNSACGDGGSGLCADELGEFCGEKRVVF